jgi:hypothetical protein
VVGVPPGVGVVVTVPEVGVGIVVGAVVEIDVGVGGASVKVGVGAFGVATIGGVKVLPGLGVSAGTASWAET